MVLTLGRTQIVLQVCTLAKHPRYSGIKGCALAFLGCFKSNVVSRTALGRCECRQCRDSAHGRRLRDGAGALQCDDSLHSVSTPLLLSSASASVFGKIPISRHVRPDMLLVARTPQHRVPNPELLLLEAGGGRHALVEEILTGQLHRHEMRGNKRLRHPLRRLQSTCGTRVHQHRPPVHEVVHTTTPGVWQNGWSIDNNLLLRAVMRLEISELT